MKLRHIIVFFLLAFASRESIAANDSISVTLDALCDGWMLHIRDIRDNGGIVRIVILDPEIARFDVPNYQMLSYPDTPTSVDARIKVRKHIHQIPFYVRVYYKNGSYSYLFKTNSGLLIPSFGVNEFYFSKQCTGVPLDTPFSIIHTQDQTQPLIVNEVYLRDSNSAFSLTSFSKQLPVVLQPGDTLRFRLKYEQRGIKSQSDAVVIHTDCFNDTLSVYGTSVGIISASDIDYGELLVGEMRCQHISIANVSVEEFQLLYCDIPAGSSNVIFCDVIPTMPITIKKGEKYDIDFCYEPKNESVSDSLIVRWKTNSNCSDLFPMVKDYSVIKGRARSQSVFWDTTALIFTTDTLSTSFRSVNFTNRKLKSTFVERFYIYGQDSAEFSIHNSLTKLSDVTLIPREINWFDIAFKPDMTKPLSQRYADRHATLVAELKDSNVMMELIGTFNPLHVKHELALEDISFSPNPVYGQDATLSFTLAEPKQLSVSIYDILGREVMAIPPQYYSSGSFGNTIASSKLGDGSYILRVFDGVLTKSISFKVMK